MGVLASPRRRRRALWVGAGVLVAGVVAAAIVALPGVHKPHETLGPGGTVPTTVQEAKLPDRPDEKIRRTIVDEVIKEQKDKR